MWFRHLSYIGSWENSFIDWIKSQNVNVWGLLFCDVFCRAAHCCSQVIAKNMGSYAGCFPILCQERGKIGKKPNPCVSSRGQVRRRKTPPKNKKRYQSSTVWKLPLWVHWRNWSEPPEFCYICSWTKHCEKQCKKCKCWGFLSVFNLHRKRSLHWGKCRCSLKA